MTAKETAEEIILFILFIVYIIMCIAISALLVWGMADMIARSLV